MLSVGQFRYETKDGKLIVKNANKKTLRLQCWSWRLTQCCYIWVLTICLQQFKSLKIFSVTDILYDSVTHLEFETFLLAQMCTTYFSWDETSRQLYVSNVTMEKLSFNHEMRLVLTHNHSVYHPMQ